MIRAVVAPPHFARVVGEGQVHGSDEALSMGLVDELHPFDTLKEAAFECAGRLAGLPARAFAATKRAIRDDVIRRARDQSERVGSEHLDLWSDPNTLDGIRAYLDRTVGGGRK